MKMRLLAFCTLILSLQLCGVKSGTEGQSSESNQGSVKIDFIYLSEVRLDKVKHYIELKDSFYTNAYDKLIVEADKALEKQTNPVTLKRKTPPSGDKHDYLSIAPYRWPNPDTKDGSPWIVKDGEINPMTTGDDTDRGRLNEMFGSLSNLSMAYYFSGESKYANQAKSIISIWFIDDSTKVNPNINYGQGIPGEVEGRRAGMIEWNGISSVITTIQLLSAKGLFTDAEKVALKDWFSDFYYWMKTNNMGIENDNGEQNHSTWYDYKLIGIARFLGLDSDVIARLEAAKVKRIATQIMPDGKQPRELGRTKSVHYCTMNLYAMTVVGEMGIPYGVDLLNYSTEDGRSVRKAYEYLRPFVQGEEMWENKQIGGAEKAIKKELIPLFSMASTIYGEALLDKRVQAHRYLSYMQRLQYPPLSR